MPKYELIHGGKPQQEAILEDLWTGLRDRIDAILPKTTETQVIDKQMPQNPTETSDQ